MYETVVVSTVVMHFAFIAYQSIVARVDGRGPPERGSRVRLCPTPGHLHFFAVDGRRIPG
ncbi:sugar ABC transporter ATP-binding protein [Mycobacterium tuberculosis]|nr:sugar ABC transporter ATP-binding protein [Mycobacterium tuberculosis]